MDNMPGHYGLQDMRTSGHWRESDHHGSGSVMIWGAISMTDYTVLIQINQNFNAIR